MAQLGTESCLLPCLLLAAAVASGCERAAPSDTGPVLVAAAADLSLVLPELAAIFERESGQSVSLSFAASGLLSKQLAQGAPFDLFAAADASFVDSAVTAGACDGASRTIYARGQIAIWSRPVAGQPVTSLRDLTDPRFERIAIANPETAPYGRAAREAMRRVGVWQELEARLVYGENVRQTLQLAETGNVEAAIVSPALVSAADAARLSRIDPALHAPLNQTLVVCRHGKNATGARAFAKLLASTRGKTLLARHGFGLPEE